MAGSDQAPVRETDISPKKLSGDEQEITRSALDCGLGFADLCVGRHTAHPEGWPGASRDACTLFKTSHKRASLT